MNRSRVDQGRMLPRDTSKPLLDGKPAQVTALGGNIRRCAATASQARASTSNYGNASGKTNTRAQPRIAEAKALASRVVSKRTARADRADTHFVGRRAATESAASRTRIYMGGRRRTRLAPRPMHSRAALYFHLRASRSVAAAAAAAQIAA